MYGRAPAGPCSTSCSAAGHPASYAIPPREGGEMGREEERQRETEIIELEAKRCTLESLGAFTDEHLRSCCHTRYAQR